MNDFLGMNAHLYKSISSRNSIKVLYSNVCHIGSNILHFSLKHFSHYNNNNNNDRLTAFDPGQPG